MKKRTRSLLDEINRLAPAKDKEQLLETRGENAISSIINLLEMIDKAYDEETAADLHKRILLSIKNRDTDRWHRGVTKIRKTK